MQPVCVVDDDPDVRQALVDLFDSIGIPVLSFECATTFLTSGMPERSAIIVSDIQMPGRSGLELLRDLRARSVDTPVILISAFVTEQSRRQATELGAAALLAKPFDAATLLACVADATSEN
jgi:FixJ family two-component response regulator